ncbi:UNKNOWN [Stylonychia lemnae]|uniref:Uncharacterized protein n=1 Tax=Stylonychia lemnae TaxID=5949 RepID=A0A078AUB6_STYLE|nr:UNKNOWN [Stylonychia lemnae]|eukprot:CDW84827.1 UNKNOWN [Stylonychia lemnae]
MLPPRTSNTNTTSNVSRNESHQVTVGIPAAKFHDQTRSLNSNINVSGFNVACSVNFEAQKQQQTHCTNSKPYLSFRSQSQQNRLRNEISASVNTQASNQSIYQTEKILSQFPMQNLKPVIANNLKQMNKSPQLIQTKDYNMQQKSVEQFMMMLNGYINQKNHRVPITSNISSQHSTLMAKLPDLSLDNLVTKDQKQKQRIIQKSSLASILNNGLNAQQAEIYNHKKFQNRNLLNSRLATFQKPYPTQKETAVPLINQNKYINSLTERQSNPDIQFQDLQIIKQLQIQEPQVNSNQYVLKMHRNLSGNNRSDNQSFNLVQSNKTSNKINHQEQLNLNQLSGELTQTLTQALANKRSALITNYNYTNSNVSNNRLMEMIKNNDKIVKVDQSIGLDYNNCERSYNKISHIIFNEKFVHKPAQDEKPNEFRLNNETDIQSGDQSFIDGGCIYEIERQDC